MKTILFSTLFYLLSAVQSAPQSNVYICDSPTAKKYHIKKDCSGLNRCTHVIKQVSKTDAVKSGYTICLLED